MAGTKSTKRTVPRPLRPSVMSKQAMIGMLGGDGHGRVETARVLLGLKSQSSIHRLPDPVNIRTADRARAAALGAGLPIPPEIATEPATPEDVRRSREIARRLRKIRAAEKVT